ncbi:MAG: hypothetical protein DI539_18615, partial [Flavobacterium psychrophilum]
MSINTYRYFFFFIIALSIAFSAVAQPQNNKPNAASVIPGITDTYMPSAYNNPQLNYVRTWVAMKSFTDPAQLGAAGFQDAKQTTEYIDGLGRPLQTVIKQFTAGSTPKDIVTPVVYDNVGRQSYKF